MCHVWVCHVQPALITGLLKQVKSLRASPPLVPALLWFVHLFSQAVLGLSGAGCGSGSVESMPTCGFTSTARPVSMGVHEPWHRRTGRSRGRAGQAWVVRWALEGPRGWGAEDMKPLTSSQRNPEPPPTWALHVARGLCPRVLSP